MVTRKDYPCAAYHIFEGTAAKAEEAAYHPSLHTNEYYEKVNFLLIEADSREDTLEILEYISKKLLDGIFLK